MRPLPSAAALALAVVAASAATAQAAPPQSATRFVEAAERGQAAVEAAAPEVERRTLLVEQDVDRCERVLDEDDHSERVGERIGLRGGAIFFAAFVHPYVETALPALRQVVADLDAVPTRDPALRAGREAWRRGVRLFEAFPAPVDRPCEVLERWRDNGFTAASAPISHRDAQRFWRTWERTDDEHDRRYGRAARRLRVLGVADRRSRAFNGHAIVDIFSDDH